MRNLISYSSPGRLALAVSLFSLVAIFYSPKAMAAPTDMPNPTNFTAGSDIYLVASSAGSGNGLDAETSTVRFYFDNPTGNQIIITSGKDQCGRPSTGTGPDGVDPTNTTFRFYNVTPSGDIGISSMARSESNMSCGDYAMNVPALTGITLPGTSTVKYILEVRAANTASGTINAFKYRISQGAGIASYHAGSGDKFAIQDRNNWSGAPGARSNFSLPFAPSCNVTTPTQVSLRWFDDDYNQGNQASGLDIQVIERRPNGSGGFTDVQIFSGSGDTVFNGNNVSGSVNITVRPGNKYIWRWNDVSEYNGIQFQLPYDGYYYYESCIRVNNFTLTCDSLRFNVTTPTASVNLRAVLYRYNPATGADEAVASRNGFDNGVTQTFNEVGLYKGFATNQFKIHVQDYEESRAIVYRTDYQTNGPCVRLACGSVSFNPASPEPGAGFRATVSMNLVNSSGAATTVGSRGGSRPWYMYYQITPGVYPMTQIGSGTITSSTGSTISATSPVIVAPTAGSYTSTWNVRYTSGGPVVSPPGNCTSGFTSYNKAYPYFMGGDVRTGANISSIDSSSYLESACAVSGIGDVLTYNTGGPDHKGAGSQLGLQAKGGVVQFVSAAIRPIQPRKPTGLTFANSGVIGNFGGTSCAVSGWDTSQIDYYGDQRSSSIIGNTVGLGIKRVITINGDLIIDSNITYTGSDGGGWSSAANIPYLKFIVAGNILIANSVDRIDANLVALPVVGSEPNTGVIATCADSVAGDFYNQASSVVASCGTSRLSINGSILAKKLLLTRLIGTAGLANVNDPGAGAAELFNGSPDSWMVGDNSGTSGSFDYQYITSLPPVL